MVRGILGRGPAYSRLFHPTRNQRGKGEEEQRELPREELQPHGAIYYFLGLKVNIFQTERSWTGSKGSTRKESSLGPFRQAVFRVSGPSRGW